MTGRELIAYILENHLENEPVIKDGKILGFVTVDEAAAKLGVGHATIAALVMRGLLQAYYVNHRTSYIPETSINKIKQLNGGKYE